MPTSASWTRSSGLRWSALSKLAASRISWSRPICSISRARPRSTRRNACTTTRWCADRSAASVTEVDSLQPGLYLRRRHGGHDQSGRHPVWSPTTRSGSTPTSRRPTSPAKKPGDEADVTVDAYPGRIWKGRVGSIAPASGSEFSIASRPECRRQLGEGGAKRAGARRRRGASPTIRRCVPA